MPREIWPSDQLGADPTDWIEFNVPPKANEEARIVRANVSFLLSNWTCIFGQGCPSVLITGMDPDIGCCQIGVHISDDEYKRVKGFVEQLGPDDADNYEEIRKRWHRHDKDEDGYTRKTVVHHGACILANRPEGRAGKLGKTGCSLHHLAAKLGVHYAETKPDICWQIPLSYEESWDEDREIMLVTLSGTPGHSWGSTYSDEDKYPGYWCVETADAYVHSKPVYASNEYELRKLMGDAPYAVLVAQLEKIQASGGRRTPMPGETANGGRKLIPLMVSNRLHVWEQGRNKKALASTRQHMTPMAVVNLPQGVVE